MYEVPLFKVAKRKASGLLLRALTPIGAAFTRWVTQTIYMAKDVRSFFFSEISSWDAFGSVV